MDSPLDRRLASLRCRYAVRSLAPTTDAATQDALFDGFVHDAMALLDAAYGPECAARVRTARASDHAPRQETGDEQATSVPRRAMRSWRRHWLAGRRPPAARLTVPLLSTMRSTPTAA